MSFDGAENFFGRILVIQKSRNGEWHMARGDPRSYFASKAAKAEQYEWLRDHCAQ